MCQNSTFIFIYTNWKLIVEKKQVADRYLVVNVSHDNVDFCIILQDLSSLLVHTVQQGHQTLYILS